MTEDKPPKKKGSLFGTHDNIRDAGLGVMIPTTIAAAILLCTGAGYYIDRRFETGPWGVIIGLIIGMVTAIRETKKSLRRIEAESDDQ